MTLIDIYKMIITFFLLYSLKEKE